MSTGSGTSGSNGKGPTTPPPPKRSPTDSSYYDCNGVVNNKNDPNAKDWNYARDVRAQVAAEKPRLPFGQRGYPSHFGNKGPDALALQPSKPLTHTPITPGSSAPYRPGNPPGAHRAVYNDKDRSQVNVIYHDHTKPVPPGSKFTPFSKATYVPGSNGGAAGGGG